MRRNRLVNQTKKSLKCRHKSLITSKSIKILNSSLPDIWFSVISNVFPTKQQSRNKQQLSRDGKILTGSQHDGSHTNTCCCEPSQKDQGTLV